MKLRFRFTVVAAIWTLTMPLGRAQETLTERTFPQSKLVVQAAVRQLQASSGGHLPVLDGFALAGEQPLDRFQKGYYQCAIQVSSTPAGGSLVRISAKITAWYNAPVASKSGYQVLPSNGRLESDLLDRLADALAAKGSSTTAPPSRTSNWPATVKGKDAVASGISAPAPDLPSAPSFKGNTFPRADHGPSPPPRSGAADGDTRDLDKEAMNLEEILRNQSHPNNLAAVRRSGTPVLASPSEGAKVLFLADAEDEFEILDSNQSWVHVRISGLSRAWIRRHGLEMPDSSESVDSPSEAPPASAPPAPSAKSNEAFRIENEQTASFPGDWEPLRGKVVRIISIQKAADSTADSGPQSKLAFVKELLNKEYDALTKTSSTVAGIVLIFDSSDGGMVAATLPAMREWKAGALSDGALWRQSYFDPPEMLHGAGGQ